MRPSVGLQRRLAALTAFIVAVFVSRLLVGPDGDFYVVWNVVAVIFALPFVLVGFRQGWRGGQR